MKDEIFDTEKIVRDIADSLTPKQITAWASNGWKNILFDERYPRNIERF